MFLHHRHHTRRAAAVTAAILTAALNSAFAPADEPAAALVLVAFSNRTGGSDIVDGNYSAAQRALERQRSSAALDLGGLETNRCVVYTMQRHLSAARSACDEAVKEVQREELTSILPTHSRRQDDTSLAVVYSNRAVVRWLSADGEEALKDLARARALAPQAPFVLRNVVALARRQRATAPAAAGVTLARVQP